MQNSGSLINSNISPLVIQASVNPNKYCSGFTPAFIFIDLIFIFIFQQARADRAERGGEMGRRIKKQPCRTTWFDVHEDDLKTYVRASI